MENINIRQAITRSVTYSIVERRIENDIKNYIVYGETTVAKEMRKYLKENENTNVIPTFAIEVITEKRAISLDKFLENSIVIEKK